MPYLPILIVFIVVVSVPFYFALSAKKHNESQFWLMVSVAFAISGSFLVSYFIERVGV